MSSSSVLAWAELEEGGVGRRELGGEDLSSSSSLSPLSHTIYKKEQLERETGTGGKGARERRRQEGGGVLRRPIVTQEWN